MDKFIDAEFKDDSPINTVNKIRDALVSSGMELEEIWLETKVPYCYALMLKIKGLNFVTSGKGLSREYARASAYGEMIERVQLGFLGRRATQKDGSYSMNDSQDVKLPIKQLLDDKMDMYQKMSERLFEWNGKKLSAEEILSQYVDEEENVLVTPFINLIDGKTVYLPSAMRKATYASNGCAAGNTFEEAIVQALGEIVERYYRLRIIKENICVPQIPDEVLAKYKTPYEMIQYIRDQGYKVWVKDCSLNDVFPVVCVCFVDTRTGRYHTHFGAYPIFEIALTRALTETFQGRSIDSFARYDDFSYTNNESEFVYNLSQELIYGTAKRAPDFFVGSTKVEYNSKVGFNGRSNRELLKECIAFFEKQGFDILVRNSSGLGFPTVQVIIPGYSETCIHRLSIDNNETRYLPYAVKTLRDPSKATIEDMMGFVMHNAESKKMVSHPVKSGFLANAKIVADISKEQEAFYLAASMAYINFAFGNYAAASKNTADMIKLNRGSKEELLICTRRYLDLKSKGYEQSRIDELLRLFHNDETLKCFYGYVNNNKNPFEEYVLHCDLQCDDSCVLKQSCYQKKAQEIIDLINMKTKELDMNEFCAVIQGLIS